MNHTSILLTLPDVSKLVDYLNLALIGLTILIFLILVLCFLRGMLRGWKKGTYHFIFMIVLFAIAIFSLDFATTQAMQINISGIKNSIDLPLGGDKTVVIQITSVGDTIRNGIITVLRDGFNITNDTTALYNYAAALTISIVKFVLVFVETLFILIFGNLLALILWHILFKFLLPYSFRKKVSLRWLSGLQSLGVAVITMSLLISPLSSLVNTVNNNMRIEFKKDQDNVSQIAQLAQGVIDTYNDSLFSKVFFSWAKPDGTNTLDYMLMDYLTKSKVGDQTVSMISEVGSFSAIGGKAAELYFGNSFEDGIAWKSLLTSTEQVTGIIQALGQTELFKVAVPFAVKVAANLDRVIEYIGQDTADYVISTDVDWQKELDIVSDLYVAAVESGGFDFVSDEHSDTPVLLFDDPYSIIFNDVFHEKLVQITSDVDKMALLDRILTGFVYTYVNSRKEQAKDNDPKTIQLIDLLPLKEDNTVDYEKMVDYQWGEELVCIIDPLYTIHDSNPAAVKGITDLMMNRFLPKEGEEAIDDESFRDDLIESVLSIAADSADDVIEAIVGPRDESANPVTDEDGKSKEDSCILDSNLIVNVMHSIPDYLGATVEGIDSGIGEVDMTDSKSVLFADPKDAGVRKAFKKELGAVLDVFGKVTSYEEGRALVKDYKNHPGVDIDPDGQFLGVNDRLCTAIQAGLRQMDNSCLLKDIVPPLGKFYIESNDAVKQMGIEKIYLEDVDFGEELANVLDIIHQCPDVIHYAGTSAGNGSAERIYASLSDAEFCDQLTKMIDIIGGCQIINPVEEHNRPIYGIISKLIPGDAALEFEEEDFDIPNLFCQYDASYNRTFKGETYYMIHAISTIVESGAMDALSESSDTSKLIHELTKIDLESVFRDIGSSSLLRKSITTKLDEQVVENMLKPSEVNVDNITFANLNVGTQDEISDNWAKEGMALNAIAALADRGVNFDSLDVFGGDGANLLGVLKKFSASGIFSYLGSDNQTHYTFNEYIYNKLLINLSGSELKYFVDENMRPFADALPSDVTLAQKQEMTTTFHANCTALDKPEYWSEDGAQLDIFIDIISSINELGGMDAMSKMTPDSIPSMRKTLNLLVDSDVCGNVVIPNAIEDAIENIDSADFDFSNANTPYLWGLNEYSDTDEAKALRRTEVTYVMNVMSSLFDTHYGIYKENPTTHEYEADLSQMNVYSISSEYFMRPVMENALESKILSTRKDPAKLSMFQLTMATFIKHSGIYGEIDTIEDPISGFNSNKYVDYSISELVEMIDYVDWHDEVDRLCNMMDRAKETIFIDPVQKNIDFGAISDPKEFFNSDVTGKNRQDLYDLVTMLNESTLFYRSLPFHLSEAFDDIQVLGSGEFIADVGYANSYFNVFMDANGRHDQHKYEASDITSMLDILETFGVKASGIDMKDITNIDAEGVTDLLAKMGQSNIFNTYNEISSPTKDLTDHKQGLTSFQCVISDFLCTDALKEYYFKDDSPKDAYHVGLNHYHNLQEKAVYETKRLMPTIAGGFGDDQIQILKGDENSLRSALVSLTDPALSNIVSSTGFEVGDLNYETFMLLLGNLNNCVLTQDIVPNAIASMVGSDTGAYNTNIDGVKFDRGNYYFSYWWYDGGDGFRQHAEPDFTQKFYEPELEQIASICSFLMINKDQIDNLDDGGGSGNFNISKIDPYLLRDLLAELNASYVFHLAGPDTFTRPTYAVNNAFKVHDNYAGVDTYLEPLSVFHQLMFKFYVESGLATQAFSPVYDIANYLQYGENDGAKVKVHENILLFEQGLGTFSHTGDWLTEIEALTTDGRRHSGFSLDDTEVGLIETIKSLNSIIGGQTASLGVNDFRKLSPAQIRWILQALNRVDIIADALPNSTRDLVTTNTDGDGLGIHKYTTYTKNYAIATPTQTWTRPDGFENATERVASRSVKFFYEGVNDGFTVSIPSAGGSLDVTSVTNAATAPSVGGYVTIDLRSVPGDFTIHANNALGRISDVSYEYDTANFRQTQASFESTDIDSIYYFLSSAYRGNNQTDGELYFHFDNDHGILEFIDETPTSSPLTTAYKHSTYGLMNFFLTSNIYAQNFDEDGMIVDADHADFTAGDYALYNLFQLEVEFNGTNVPVNIADNFGSGTSIDHLRYLNFQRHHYYPTAMGIEHALYESTFLDNYIVGAGTLQAYIDSAKTGFTEPPALTKSDTVFLGSSFALGQLQYDGVHDYLDNVMSSAYENDVNGHYDASIGGCPDEFKISLSDPSVREAISGSTDVLTDPGYIGKSILAGQVENMLHLNYESINLANDQRAIPSPTHASTERSDLFGVQGNIDAYGYDDVEQKYTFSALKSNVENALFTTETLHLAFAGMDTLSLSTMNVAQKEDLASSLESLDALTGDSKTVMDAFYLGTLYNVLVSRGVFYGQTITGVEFRNDFADMVNATNFAQDNDPVDPLHRYQSNLAFSYAALAQAIRDSAF